MPITTTMVQRTRLAEKTAHPRRASGREKSYGNEPITPEIALTVSAVLAAFTILTEDLASLPLLLYVRRGRNRYRAYDSVYYRLMHDQPNPEHSAMIFRELAVGHLLGWGNFYGQMIWDKAGQVREIWPLRPDRMSVGRVDGERVFGYVSTSGEARVFLRDEILHIPAFGFDGLVGLSRIAQARNAIGLAIATERFGSQFFSNGANLGTVFRHPAVLDEDAYERLKKSLDEHTGPEAAHKPFILEEGMELDKLGIPPEDAQFLETRKFQVSEIARIFRVPPHMIGDVERSTSWGSGIDSQEQGYVNHTLRPWAVRIEQGLNTQILPVAERADYAYEHLMDGLLRGDIQTRYEAYVKAINNGIMSRNEARARENLNPYQGGDVMMMPSNMITVNSGGGLVPESALEPLWRDAVARVVRREINDVSGAWKRWQAKGQAQAFTDWLGDFYGHDLLEFASQQLQPVLVAQKRLFGSADGARCEQAMIAHLAKRHNQIVELAALNAEPTPADWNAYKAIAIDELIAALVLDAPQSQVEANELEADDGWNGG